MAAKIDQIIDSLDQALETTKLEFLDAYGNTKPCIGVLWAEDGVCKQCEHYEECHMTFTSRDTLDERDEINKIMEGLR